MNTARIFTLADFVENHQPGLGFNMSYYLNRNTDGSADLSGYHCGTVACIAGHEALRIRMEASGFKRVFKVLEWMPKYGDQSEHNAARKSLGLTRAQARDLFVPWDRVRGDNGWRTTEEDQWDAGEGVTPQMAARVLRNLAITGKVDWAVAYGPAPAEIEVELFRLAEANRTKQQEKVDG